MGIGGMGFDWVMAGCVGFDWIVVGQLTAIVDVGGLLRWICGGGVFLFIFYFFNQSCGCGGSKWWFVDVGGLLVVAMGGGWL